MNSFRVIDTRFRILKGGKIGLAMSIALIAGMLTLGGTKAAATDYFTDVDAGLSTPTYSSGSISLNLQTAANAGITSVVRTENTSDDIVIKPTSWANSFYNVPTYSPDYYGDASNQQAFTLNKTTDSLVLDLTFSSGANAGNISKNTTTIYNTDATIAVFASTTKNLVPTALSTAYTANLIFNGSNTVSGNTNIDAGNIQIKGNNVTFEGNIESDTMDINSLGFANLNTVSGTTTSDIVFSGAGTANLYRDLIGNITTTVNNQGTLTTTGTNQTITGNIGTSALLDLSTLNIGSSTSPTNYSVTTINGNVYANSTVLNNNGSTNSSELILSSGKNITSSISTADVNMGVLTLAGGIQIVTGQVGTNTERLAQVNSGVNGSNSTFVNDVYAVNVTNTGTGTTNFKNDVKATNVNVNAGTTNFEDNLTAATTTITTGTGNFNTVSGSTSSNIVFTNAGTANLYDDLTGNVTTNADNQGTFTIVGSSSGKAQVINGNIGTSSSSDLNILNIGSATVATNYSTTIINGNVYANSTVLNNGTTASSELILSSGNNITSTITTADNGKGILTLVGGTQTISGTVGGAGASLKEINAGANGATSTFSTDVFATNLDVTGTGTVNLNGDYTGTAIRYNADGTVVLGTGSDVNSAITNNTGTDSQGILTLVGGTQTISGTVGGAGASLKEINAGANGATSTFSTDVFATNLDVTGTGTVNLNGDYTGTAIRYNADGTVVLGTGSDVNSAITNNTGTDSQGILTLVGGTQTISGTVGGAGASLKEINAGANGATSTFSTDVFATNLDVTGTGTVNLNGDYTGTAIRYNADGTVVLGTGSDVNSAITNNTGTDSQGILTLVGGTQTISGTVGGAGASLKEINAGANGATSTFSTDVFATNLDVTGTGTVILNSNLTGNVVITGNNQGILTTTGITQTITGDIGSSISSDLNTLNIGSDTNGTNYSKTTINGNIFANSTVLNNNGTTNSSELIMSSGKNITSTITTTDANMGILTLVGGIQTVTGEIGTDTERLAQVNSGENGAISTFVNDVYAVNVTNTGSGTTIFQDDVIATNVNINAGTTNFQDNLTATTTTITSGIGNFNTVSGTTSSDIVFGADGIANLNNGLTGDINFAGNNATTNVSDGKGILGSIETLATNNTGIVNFKGDGTISGNVGSSIYGIKELNINTNNEQNNTDGVLVTFDALGREIYADVIALKNNATLTLSDGVDIINTGSDNIIVTVDSTNTGILTFQGTSNIEGEVGQSDNVLNTINAGANGKIVTFDDMVYASNLKYLDNGKVVLNGDNSSNANAEGLKGRVDFDSKAGTLEFGDDVNLTTGTTGTQFINANNATLAFNGSSTVIGNLGSENGTNDTFKTINAGTLNETVKFEDNIYVMDSLNLSSNGKVQIADGNYVKRNTNSATTGAMITTSTDGFGDLEYLGTTLLYSDIGTSSKKLNNVTFASSGTASNIYNQDIDKNIYALNTHIGNGSNETILNIKDDLTFGGNLDLRSNSTLNISDYDVIVNDNLNVVSNSTLKFKVYTTDISNGEAVENPKSGSIAANTITMANDIKINIEYDGSWYGSGKYNLITATAATTDYYGTEANGLVSDNSIIDSVIRKDGTNLTLFADRTGGGSYNPEDLYIIKSDIGEHYSNGASQSLAGYANEAQREGALADIIRKMEELDGGSVVSDDKKEEMIKTQKLLAPNPNNSTIKSSLMASNSVLSTVGERINDIRYSTNSIPYNYSGLSSGNNTLDYALWIKGTGAKATQSKVEDYDGYDSSTYGFVMGMDKTFRNDVIIGLSAAHSTTQINQTDFREDDSSDTKSNQITTYIAKEFEDTYVNGLVSYGTHSTDSIRTANSGKLSSSVDAEQLTAKIEAGHNINFGKDSTLTPFVSVEYGTLNQKAYTEKGTKYQNDALKVDSIKLNKGNVAVGAKVSTQLNLGDALIIPEAKIAVYNSFGDKDIDIKAQYTGGGNKFVTPTQELSGSGYNAGLSVRTPLSESTSLTIGVDYDRSKDGDFEGYSGNVAFRLNF